MWKALALVMFGLQVTLPNLVRYEGCVISYTCVHAIKH